MTASDASRRATTLQAEARALGDATRHAIFRYLVDRAAPVGVAELTERFRFNHNAIRQHLAKLVDAGLVVEAKAPSTGRGRPRLLYAVDPAADGRWGTESPYERLSRLLVEVIQARATPAEVGRRYGATLGGGPGGDAIPLLHAEMARQGFEPEVRHEEGDVELVLHNCPFETAALADRETVCAVHLGIAQGLADGTSVAVHELIANDPSIANCQLRLRAADPEDGDTGAASLKIRRGRGGRRRR